jgi:hypothetical protein
MENDTSLVKKNTAILAVFFDILLNIYCAFSIGAILPEPHDMSDPDATTTVGTPNISILLSIPILGVGIPQISIPAYGAF